MLFGYCCVACTLTASRTSARPPLKEAAQSPLLLQRTRDDSGGHWGWDKVRLFRLLVHAQTLRVR
jgi:hypothetical protein